MNRPAPHPDSGALLRLVDEDLSSTEIVEHVAACAECSDRLNTLREALDDYERFHRTILKLSLPSPPNPWTRLEFPKARRTHFRPAPWLALAAAIAAVFVLVRVFEHPPGVSAAELLRKASAVERAAAASHRRIRIRTRTRTVDREARLAVVPAAPERAGESALHDLFDAAGYSWDNPLSVEAFSRWRDSLPAKEDRIEENAGVYEVRTFAREGPLADASLSLRANDLHALSCTLRFRSGGEIIDVTEASSGGNPRLMPVPGESGPSAPAEIGTVPAQPQPSRMDPARALDAGDEVHVIAALHGIGADLGEPVEVERAGATIVVHVTGLDPHRCDEIRAALSGMPFVELRFENVRRGEARGPLANRPPAVPADRTNSLVSELAARPGSTMSIAELTDELIDVTDRAAVRAYSLRALARRFPQEVTSNLSRSDAATLRDILSDHTRGLVTAVQEIRRLIDPILQSFPTPPDARDPRRWQPLAEGLPALVDRLDRTLNEATDTSDARKGQLAEAVARLDRQAGALQLAVRQ